MGGGGKRGPRAWWHISGGARQWRFQARHRSGPSGVENEAGSRSGDAFTDSAKGRRSEEGIAQRSESAARSGETAGTSDARGSSVAAAVDLQERAEPRRRTASPGSRGEPYAGCGTVARTEVQPAGESQDQGGLRASGPQCTVSIYQYQGDGVPEEWPASYFSRHEKEGTGGGLQEWRPRVAAQGSARTR